MNRSIKMLYLALAAGFGLLVLMLGYWQVVAAGGLNERADNPYHFEEQRLVDRGRIISADKVVMAESVAYRQRGKKYFKRYYPQGALAAHVVGYATPQQGSTGLESQYNQYLAGSYGTGAILDKLRAPQKQGADIRLTLDTRVQKTAEALLKGKRGAVVAIDPQTGQVLALTSSPAFDLNQVASDFASIRKQSGGPLVNRATQGRYPPRVNVQGGHRHQRAQQREVDTEFDLQRYGDVCGARPDDQERPAREVRYQYAHRCPDILDQHHVRAHGNRTRRGAAGQYHDEVLVRPAYPD